MNTESVLFNANEMKAKNISYNGKILDQFGNDGRLYRKTVTRISFWSVSLQYNLYFA